MWSWPLSLVRRAWIVSVNGRRAGVVRASLLGDVAEIHVAIHVAFRGFSLGTKAILEAAQWAHEKCKVPVGACIKCDNRASIRTFTKAGFGDWMPRNGSVVGRWIP